MMLYGEGTVAADFCRQIIYTRVQNARADTTTIRVDRVTHARFLELSKASGRSLTETLQDAAEVLRRVRFAEQVQYEIEALRQHPDDWAGYLTEAAATEVGDGVG